MNSECKLEEKLLGLVLGELEADEKSRVQEHVDGCTSCQGILTDLKVGVEKFHQAYPEVPDVPKKLSQARFEEILSIAKELEDESPNTWTRKPAVKEGDDDPAGMSSWLAIIIGILLALIVIAVILRPWDKPGRMTNDPDTPTQPNNPGKGGSGNGNSTKAGDGGATSIDGNHTRPKDGTGGTGSSGSTAAKPTDGSGSGTSSDTGSANGDTSNGGKATKDPAEKTGQADTPFADPNRDYRSIVVIVELQRNQIPQRVPPLPTEAGSAVTFTPKGSLMRIRKPNKPVPAGTKKATIDDRPQFKINYQTDALSANALIELNDKLILAGARAANKLRFDVNKKQVEVVGNRQELNDVHRLLGFLSSPNAVLMTSDLATTDPSERPANDEDLVTRLKRMPLKRHLTATRTTFAAVMKTLTSWGGCPLVDMSGQSMSRLHVDFENVSVWDAVNQLCKAVNVTPVVTRGTINLMGEQFSSQMTTSIVKISPTRFKDLLKENRAASLPALIAANKIDLPKGAGVGVTDAHTIIIIHHYRLPTGKILKLISPCRLKKGERP